MFTMRFDMRAPAAGAPAVELYEAAISMAESAGRAGGRFAFSPVADSESSPAASGMAAGYSTMCALLSSGDHVVSCRAIFGSTHQLFTKVFPRFGITI